MESQVLNGDIEWEAGRHAAAFGFPGWDVIGCDCEEGGHRLSFRAKTEGLLIECRFELDEEEQGDWGLSIDDYGGGVFMEEDMFVELTAFNGDVVCEFHLPPSKKNKADEIVARLLKAAYLLGLPITAFETELGLSLSHHEKLELRLSMPREYWPKTWLDEEAEQDARA